MRPQVLLASHMQVQVGLVGQIVIVDESSPHKIALMTRFERIGDQVEAFVFALELEHIPFGWIF